METRSRHPSLLPLPSAPPFPEVQFTSAPPSAVAPVTSSETPPLTFWCPLPWTSTVSGCRWAGSSWRLSPALLSSTAATPLAWNNAAREKRMCWMTTGERNDSGTRETLLRRDLKGPTGLGRRHQAGGSAAFPSSSSAFVCLLLGYPRLRWTALTYSLETVCFQSSFLGLTPSASGICEIMWPETSMLSVIEEATHTEHLSCVHHPKTHRRGPTSPPAASPRNSLEVFKEVLTFSTMEPSKKISDILAFVLRWISPDFMTPGILFTSPTPNAFKSLGSQGAEHWV